MDAIILKQLTELMPLWTIIIIAIMFVGMRFYYTRFAKLEDTTSKLEGTTSKLKETTSKLEDTVSRTDDRLRSIEELLVSLNSKSVEADADLGTLFEHGHELGNRLSALEEVTVSLSSELESWRVMVENKLTTTDRRLDNDEDILNTIAKWVVKQDETMIDDIMKKRSPYTLTNIGEQILDDSGARQVLEQCMAQYIADLEAKAPKTAYDVEDLAYDVLFKHSGDDAFKPIKDYLYLAPDPATFYSEDKGQEVEVRLSLMSVLRVMSLPLRDAYLNLHPELNPLEDPH